jgi:hypothetical protein
MEFCRVCHSYTNPGRIISEADSHIDSSLTERKCLVNAARSEEDFRAEAGFDLAPELRCPAFGEPFTTVRSGE